MNTTRFFQLLIALLFVLGANAQNYTNSKVELEGFQEKPAEMSFLSSQNSKSSFNKTPVTNNVFISQVGSDNNAIVDTKSNNADLKITQKGYNNELYYQVSAASIVGDIVQNGDSNSIFHTNPYELKSHNAEILQNGNNQNVEWSGSNSISEKIKMSMQGDNQTIIIRNLN